MPRYRWKVLTLLLTLAILFSTWPAISLADSAGDWLYSTSTAGATVTGYSGPGGQVAIPDTLGGLSVVGLGMYLFSGRSDITSVFMPETVRNIGSCAFQSCSGIANIHFPRDLRIIGNGAFYNCSSLENVSIPSGVTSIGPDCFCLCTSLREVTLPSGLATLGANSFRSCTSLDYINLSNALTSIGDDTFFQCTSLAAIDIPRHIHSIGTDAFGGCSSLVMAFFYGPRPSIGARAFSGADASFQILYHIAQQPSWLGYSEYPTGAFCKVTAHLYEGVTPIVYLYRLTSDNKMMSTPPCQARAGFAFVGWYKEAACTHPWDFTSAVITNDINIYAKWNILTPAAPGTVTDASASYNSIRISWHAAANATGYEIWRTTSASGTYVRVGITSAVSYTDTGLTTNQPYWYVIRSVNQRGTIRAYSTYAAALPIGIKPVPSAPASITVSRASSRSANITWSAVAGATGYQVYRKTTATGTFTLIRTTTNRSFLNTGLTTGTVYYYRVRAYRLVGGTRVYGVFSVIRSVTP